MKRAIYCALISAIVGFAMAAWLANPTPSPSTLNPSSSIIPYVLCPPAIFAAIFMTDPDAGSIWFFFGPLNALIYGAVGFTLWLLVVGDDDNSAVSKKEGSDLWWRRLVQQRTCLLCQQTHPRVRLAQVCRHEVHIPPRHFEAAVPQHAL